MFSSQLLDSFANIALERVGDIEFDGIIFAVHHVIDRLSESILQRLQSSQAAFLASSACTMSLARLSSTAWSVMASPAGVVR